MARQGVHLGNTQRRMDVPVQYFQSVIAIELAVAGAIFLVAGVITLLGA